MIDVDPAEINGSGNPVGGIEPVNISCCIIKYFSNETMFATENEFYTYNTIKECEETLKFAKQSFKSSAKVHDLALTLSLIQQQRLRAHFPF